MRSERLEKYREERRRYLAKLDYIQARIKELDQKIMEGENLEIRALMRTENMTLISTQSTIDTQTTTIVCLISSLRSVQTIFLNSD